MNIAKAISGLISSRLLGCFRASPSKHSHYSIRYVDGFGYVPLVRGVLGGWQAIDEKGVPSIYLENVLMLPWLGCETADEAGRRIDKHSTVERGKTVWEYRP